MAKFSTWNCFSDEGVRLACGLTLQAMSRYSPDIMKRHTAKALPAVFFAMHEKNKTEGNRVVVLWLAAIFIWQTLMTKKYLTLSNSFLIMFTASNSSSSNDSLWEEIWLENTPGNVECFSSTDVFVAGSRQIGFTKKEAVLN